MKPNNTDYYWLGFYHWKEHLILIAIILSGFSALGIFLILTSL